MAGHDFNPEAILQVLDRHRVDYILVGGYAANVHGATRPTMDIDITPAGTSENLTRLAEALRDMGAGIRVNGIAEGLPFDTSAEALRGMSMLNLRTSNGDLDLTFFPAGFPGGYADLVVRAQRRTVTNIRVLVAALDDIITSKEEAGRPKDRVALPELHRLAADRPNAE